MRYDSHDCIIGKRDFADIIKVPISCNNQKIVWVGLMESPEPLKGIGTSLKSESLEGPVKGAMCQGPERSF